MKHIFKSILLLTLPLLSGCRYSFDINDSGLEPRICVMSYICSGEEAEIEVYKTVPVYATGNADMTLISPSYSLKCNGKEVEIFSAGVPNDGLMLSSPAFKAGDVLELTVGAEGLETVTASTTIPGGFPGFTQEYGFDEDGNRSITLQYEKEREGYYGANVEYRIEGKSGFVYEGFAFPIEGYDDLSINSNAYSPIVTYINDKHIFVWDDEADGKYEIKFRDNTLTKGVRKYRLHLYRLSEEMYRKLNAEYDADSNPFAGLGLSSPSFTYSNIDNGTGWFCAYSKTVSDWMIE
jgi:hypothetical protein